MGWGPSPRVSAAHRCTEEACRGAHEVIGETFPARRAFSGLQFLDNREASRGFRQRNVHMWVFSGGVTLVAEKDEGELRWAEPRQPASGATVFQAYY